MSQSAYEELKSQLAALKQDDAFRQCKLIINRGHKKAEMNGRSMLNLSSNDYLGLSTNIALHETFFQTLHEGNRITDFGLSSSSSRLLTGHHEQVAQLENELKTVYGREGALVFNSGYHANTGILASLLGKDDVIFCDRLNHASIIDGMRLSGAKSFRYRHGDMNHLEALLKKHRHDYKRALIISESIFSMDGDRADLHALIDCRNRFQTWLYIDEAHGVGVLGENGLGLSEEEHVIDQIDFIVGTFGKAFASIGAFIICDKPVEEYLVNTMRPFIFTTALPPVNVHWSRFILSIMPQLKNQRQHLLKLADTLRHSLTDNGLTTLGSSQIVPVIIGQNDQAVSIANACQERHLLVFPIRPPTVPKGQARLRLSLTASLKWEDVKSIPPLVAEQLKDRS